MNLDNFIRNHQQWLTETAEQYDKLGTLRGITADMDIHGNVLLAFDHAILRVVPSEPQPKVVSVMELIEV